MYAATASVLSSTFVRPLSMSRLHQLLPELVANFLLPWLCYRWAVPQWGETAGLIVHRCPHCCGAVSNCCVFAVLMRSACWYWQAFCCRLLAMLLGGSPRVLLMRESLLSGLFGLAFLLSLLSGKPLLFYLARATVARESAEGGGVLSALAGGSFRRGIRQLTLVVGNGSVPGNAIACLAGLYHAG
jgi:hypothetical protein